MRFLSLLAALPLMACSVGAGNATGVAGTGSGGTRSFAVADFARVSLRGSDDVDVRVGSAFSVRAEGPADELDKLLIERDGDTLKVGRKPGIGISWGGHSKVHVYVTMPSIAGASVAGSGNLAVDRAEGSAFDAAVSGSGNLAVAAIAVERAKLSIAGSGDLSIAGTTTSLEMKVAGSGDIAARRLTASQAQVSIAGSGNVAASVDGPAKVSIAGSGDADLGSKARCTTSKMGSGSVTCGA